jgi:hypothetical protein
VKSWFENPKKSACVGVFGEKKIIFSYDFLTIESWISLDGGGIKR